MYMDLGNLCAGLQWWSDQTYPSDLHNAEYCEIYQNRANGINGDWWLATVSRLGRWRAYRGRTPPNTKDEILSRGLQVWGDLSGEYQALIGRANGEPSITSSSWEDVQGLFNLALTVKRSPVFASKMCHFVFPKLFIVMDNTLTQVFDYEFYWRGMKCEWARFREKDGARTRLTDAISSTPGPPMHENYPIETKVMELSHIGYKRRFL